MTKFVVVTDTRGNAIRVNVDQIACYAGESGYKRKAVIKLTGGEVLDLVQAPEGIDALIREANETFVM